MVLQDTTLDRNSQHARTKITIPQEPDFATSQRAHRIRLEPKSLLKTGLLQERLHISPDVLVMIISGARMMRS